MKKYVYLFSEGDASMRNLLGGKGANLAEMTKLGLPVPQGFTITTEACTRYYDDDRQINADIQAQIDAAVLEMEKITGKKFGDKQNPLLVSVRSGARASMPGMMDTILNLGLNEEVVEIIAAKTGNERWARDCYRRFIQMYSDVVMEVGKKYFEELIDRMKAARGVTQDVELTAADLKELAEQLDVDIENLDIDYNVLEPGAASVTAKVGVTDTSSDVSSSASSTPADSSSTPSTSDVGIAAIIVLAVAAVIGAAVIIRKRG